MKKTYYISRSLQFICISGASLLYYVPYMITSYYDVLRQAFHASNTELGLLTSCYTTVTFFTYFLGGIIADKFSSRKLLTFSYISTGVLCLLFSTFPGLILGMVIMGAMGVTTILTFWAAMQKATRIFVGVGNEGLGTGGVEFSRNVLSSIIATIALIGFGLFADKILGLQFVIWCFAASLFVIGIGSWFLLEKEDPKESEDGTSFFYIVTCLKNPNIWIASVIIGFSTISYICFRYIAPYGTNVLGLSLVMGALLGTFKEYFRPVGGLIVAFLSNRYGVSKMLMMFSVFAAIITVLIAFLPQNSSFILFVFLSCAIGYVIFGAIRGIYLATTGEGGIPMEMTGTAIGIMSTIGFLPDAFMRIILGWVLDSMPEAVAYPVIFRIAAVFSLLTITVVWIFYRKNKTHIDEMMASKEEARLRKKAQKNSTVL